mmetsp:Transcript_32210/g.62894  ORF Transcript_32210/g.62894 Transcript_32210/m.62894 type:complete len:219 (-) Transcript_32210:271-927(-)
MSRSTRVGPQIPWILLQGILGHFLRGPRRLVLDTLQRIIVHLVLETALWDLALQALGDGDLELPSDLHARLLVIRRTRPHRHPVSRLAKTDDSPTQLIAAVKVLSDHSQDRVKPHIINQFLPVLLGDAVRPLPPRLVGHVLPHGLYPALENVVVASWVEPRGRPNVVENSPEVLNHIERRHLLQVRAPVARPEPLDRIVEPQHPRVLEGMLHTEINAG